MSRAHGEPARESRVALESNTCEATTFRVLVSCKALDDGVDTEWLLPRSATADEVWHSDQHRTKRSAIGPADSSKGADVQRHTIGNMELHQTIGTSGTAGGYSRRTEADAERRGREASKGWHACELGRSRRR